MTASTVRAVFTPFVEVVKTLNLPEWLVHWGHPGNMVRLIFHHFIPATCFHADHFLMNGMVKKSTEVFV